MKESYGKDPASHPDPESCVGGREDAGEALTGAHAGQPLSSEITLTGVPTPYGEGEGNMADGAKREPAANAVCWSVSGSIASYRSFPPVSP